MRARSAKKRGAHYELYVPISEAVIKCDKNKINKINQCQPVSKGEMGPCHASNSIPLW